MINGDDNFYINVSEDILKEFYNSSTPESLQYVNLKINPQTFLDILLMEIRGVTIAYSSKKKRERKQNEIKIMHDIELLESKIDNELNNESFKAVNAQLLAKKVELEEIFEFQAQGAYIRARARHKLEGEKPSKLFCSLEKHNSIQKHIPRLVIEQNEQEVVINDQKNIETETFRYYRNLFSE